MSIRNHLIESGLFVSPQTLSWPGDGSRQAIGTTRAKFPVDAVIGEALRALGRLTRKLQDGDEEIAAKLRSAGHPVINSGTWRIMIHSVWSRQRHLDRRFALGDVDAPVSAVLDALQEIGVLDDDVRVVEQAATKGYDPARPRVIVTLEACDP